MLLTHANLVGVRAHPHLLRGAEMATLPVLENAWLWVKKGRIADYGQMGDPMPTDPIVKPLDGRYVLPAWCDAHTHLVFARSREGEFVDKIRGASYAEIAAKGGGILNSARAVQETDAETLYAQAWERLQEVMRLGTGALEMKSGYGLSVAGELKLLRVMNRLKENAPIPIKTTFLGAHAYPSAYKDDHEGYLRLVETEMLPVIAAEGLADYIDVFCEEGFFSVAETQRILEAGQKYGLKAKLHANQLTNSGGVQVGVACGAVSVDHLECIGQAEIEALQSQQTTIPTALPGCAFFLRLPYPPARDLLNAGLPLAIATDFNPGSAPSGNMNLAVSLACIQMRLTPEEAINAASLNGAYAMEVAEEVGSLTCGKRANFMILKPIPSLAFLPYAFGSNLIEAVFINGEALL